MQSYEVQNPTKNDRAVRAYGGLEVVHRNKSKVVTGDWDEEYIGLLEGHGLVVAPVEDDETDESTLPNPITPEAIATMRKADLVTLLETHSAPTDGTAEELRARLVEVMFVNDD